MSEPIEMDLVTLCGGGAVERFRLACAEVGKNIADPNTDPLAKRQVVLTVTFSPNRDRTESTIEVDAKTKLAGPLPLASRVFTSLRPGNVVGFVEAADPRQQVLDVVAALRPTVVPKTGTQ